LNRPIRIIQDVKHYADYLESEKIAELENIRNAPFIKCKITHINPSRFELITCLLLERHRDFQIKTSDAVEIRFLKRPNKLGVLVEHSGEEYTVAVSKDVISLYSEGDLIEIREANVLLIIEAKMAALTKYQERENKLVQKFRNIFEGRPLLPPVSQQEVSFHDPKLNKSQKKAIAKCMGLKDDNFFYLIYGPPGTGKTRTIAELAYQIVQKGESVLISSHTNVAVDNVLIRLSEIFGLQAPNIMARLGIPLKVDARIEPFIKPLTDLTKFIKKHRVIGATLSKDALLTYLSDFDWITPLFDYIIIDESSMADFSLTLMGLVLAKKFILVGDYHQLPPIITVTVAPEVKMSLFEKLCKAYERKKDDPRSVLLNVQYRSNKKIMEWSNKFFYFNQIATDSSVENNQLDIISDDEILKGENPIIWIDTYPYSEMKWNKFGKIPSAYNIYEAAICLYLIKKFQSVGVRPVKDLVPLSPYRLQSELMRQLIGKITHTKEEIPSFLPDNEEKQYSYQIKASTIDAFQGQEFPVIIVLLTDDGTRDKASRGLQDYRRLNVGVTRASKKLIIIGSLNLTDRKKTNHIHYLHAYISQAGKVIQARELFSPEKIKLELEQAEAAFQEIIPPK